jgi:mono/diheme cytochrome c family protein
MRFIPISTGFLALFALAVVEGKSVPAKKAVDLAEGKKVFEVNCVACHGATGKGDGAAAVALTPKPRDFTDVAYMKKRSVDTLRLAISEGGQSVGLSPVMVGWKASLTPVQIESVLQYVLTFSKPSKAAGAKKAK